MTPGNKTKIDECEIRYFCRTCWHNGIIAVTRPEIEGKTKSEIETEIGKHHNCRLIPDCRIVSKIKW